uniref:CC142 N-terminal domain-containing protein n=1 Tax=Leptobrachium leishanense TaxID=445787 RepID=A0A8C5PGM4_9ANUR
MEGFNLKSPSMAKTEPEMSQLDDGKWISNLSSSLMLQGAEDATRSAEGSVDLPCPCAGNVYSPLDRALLGAARHLVCASTQVAGPGQHVTRLLMLALQRRLLSTARDYTACLKNVTDLVLLLCEHSARPIRGVAELVTICAQLWGQIQRTLSFHRKVQADPWLLLLSPTLRPATRDMSRVLAQWCVQAVLLTDLCIQSVLCTLAQEPDWDMGQLVPSLALYNQAVSEIKSWTHTWRRPRTYPPARVMELLAEERGLSLARSFCCSLRAQGLQQVLGMDSSFQRVLRMDSSGQRGLGVDSSGQRGLGMNGSGQWGLGMDGSGQWQLGGFLQESVEDLVGLLQEERRHVSGLLQALACSGHGRWSEKQEDHRDLSEAALFTCYSTHVWASFSAHIYQAFYGGSRRSEDLLAVFSSRQAAILQVIDALTDTLASARIPDLCRSESRRLIARLLCTRVFITWDQRKELLT